MGAPEASAPAVCLSLHQLCQVPGGAAAVSSTEIFLPPVWRLSLPSNLSFCPQERGARHNTGGGGNGKNKVTSCLDTPRKPTLCKPANSVKQVEEHTDPGPECALDKTTILPAPHPPVQITPESNISAYFRGLARGSRQMHSTDAPTVTRIFTGRVAAYEKVQHVLGKGGGHKE